METQSKLSVRLSPHFKAPISTQRIMMLVVISLLPAGIASIIIFGFRALALMLVCIGSCVLFEYLYCRITKQARSIDDLSAVVTGLLLAYNLPVSLPFWMAIVGCFFAIVIFKQLFGGIGRNFVNPAIAGRIMLMISFTTQMTSWTVPGSRVADAITSATPLGILAEGGGELPTYLNLLIGNHGGSLGETCAIALLVGGIFLIVCHVIQPTIPVIYIGCVALFTALLGQDPLFHILSGGLMLGAFFMATDYTTCPITMKGKIIYAVGCAILTVVIRCFGSYPEGVSFAIILMNVVTPLIDRYCETKPFGANIEKKNKKEAAE